LWNAIKQLLDAAQLEYPKCRLYQDGLPVCGMELKIVREVAARGSRNHQLLVTLIDRGAILEGTEDSVLLRGEYERVKTLLHSPPAEQSSAPMGPKPNSTAERDQWIARRIDSTLLAGETGILFIGLLHRVEDFLPEDIRTRFLLPRPGSRGG